MVNQDILGALKSALARKYSLAQAKQTLVNSGYSPQEIKEAEAALNSPTPVTETKTPAKQIAPVTSPTTKSTTPQTTPASQPLATTQKPLQDPHKKKKMIIIMIAAAIILLGGALLFFLSR